MKTSKSCFVSKIDMERDGLTLLISASGLGVRSTNQKGSTFDMIQKWSIHRSTSTRNASISGTQRKT